MSECGVCRQPAYSVVRYCSSEQAKPRRHSDVRYTVIDVSVDDVESRFGNASRMRNGAGPSVVAESLERSPHTVSCTAA